MCHLSTEFCESRPSIVFLRNPANKQNKLTNKLISWCRWKLTFWAEAMTYQISAFVYYWNGRTLSLNKKLSCRGQTARRICASAITWLDPTSVIQIRLKKIDSSHPVFQGHSRSLEPTWIDPPSMISYYCAIATLSLRHIVFETFDFIYAVTLISGLVVRKGHWTCHNSIERMWLPIDVL